MPIDVLEAQNAIGLCGSDTLDEHPAALSRLSIQELGALGSLRLALLARRGLERQVREMLETGDQLSVGTSYPGAVRKYMGSNVSADVVRKGCIEGLLERYPGLDAVVDIVDTGNTSNIHDLTEVVTVVPITLALIMKKETKFTWKI